MIRLPRNRTGLRRLRFLTPLTTGVFVLLIASCGLLDSDQDPDEILSTRNLTPRLPVAGVVYSAPPDSSGGTDPLTLRWTVSAEARTALTAGGVLEALVRAAPGEATTISGRSASAGTWHELVTGTGAGPDSLDLWWLGAWNDRAEGTDLVDPFERVRLRIPAHASPARAVVRVLEIPNAVWTREAPGRTLSAVENNLLLMGGGTLWRWSVQGAPLESLGAAGAPPSFCRTATRYFGVTETEILVLSTTSGTWIEAADLPWDSHGGVAITSDGEDLYLVRHVLPESASLPRLYQLSESLLLQTHSFAGAVTDSTTLRRNGMRGGEGPGLAWWPDRRVLAAPGTQADVFGLVTFTRAGRFREFIPLPFSAGPIQIAFADEYLFIARARPTLAALGWSGTFTPARPEAALLWRWPAP